MRRKDAGLLVVAALVLVDVLVVLTLLGGVVATDNAVTGVTDTPGECLNAAFGEEGYDYEVAGPVRYVGTRTIEFPVRHRESEGEVALRCDLRIDEVDDSDVVRAQHAEVVG